MANDPGSVDDNSTVDWDGDNNKIGGVKYQANFQANLQIPKIQ